MIQTQLKRERTGQPLILGNKLASGGEGSIYVISQTPGQVAKIYSKPTTDRAAKLQAMIASPPPNPTYHQGHVSIAWPTDRLFDANRSCVGFVMPFIDPAHSVPLLKLYHPADRQQTAPGFTWLYLIRTASNLASSTAALHAGGYVVGDLNESNVLVSDTALTTLVDCDSMQVHGAGKTFRCTVGKPDYTPPELQGLDFSQIDRTSHHDDFALAVLVFLLLMEGVHPFDGVWHGRGLDPTREQKIRSGAWPYADNNSGLVTPPPLALPFGILPTRIQGLMKRCFVDGAQNPAARPRAAEWQAALRDAEQHLQRCTTNPQHLYSQHLSTCPWCARMAQYRVPDPFPLVAQQPLPRVGVVISPARPTIPLFQTPPITQPPSPTTPLPQGSQLYQTVPVVPPLAHPAPVTAPYAFAAGRTSFTWGEVFKFGIYSGVGGAIINWIYWYLVGQYYQNNSVSSGSAIDAITIILMIVLLIGPGVLPEFVVLLKDNSHDYMKAFVVGIVSGDMFLSAGTLIVLVVASQPPTDFSNIGADIGVGLLVLIGYGLVATPVAALSAFIAWIIAKIRR